MSRKQPTPAPVPRRRTQAERRDQAESSLMDAAIDLIARKGLDGFTLNEVGEAAGYSRGLPVHYFGTKENLLGLVARQLLQSYLAQQDEVPTAPPGMPRLARTIRHYCGMPIGSRSVALRILIANAPVHPFLHEVIEELNRTGLTWLTKQVQAGIDAGTVRPDVDAAGTALMMYSFLRGLRGFRTQSPSSTHEAAVDSFIAAVTDHLRIPEEPTPAKPLRPKSRAAAPRKTDRVLP